jgi:citrate synthase
MRGYLAIYAIGILILGGLVVVQVTAQESAQERAAGLRTQLADTQARQAELQARLRQLDEDLKPENIERSLAGVGSTHPEELREARRRQLEIQKKSIQSQLDILGDSRTRLEAAIASTEAEIYRQNAGSGFGTRPPEENNRSAISNSTRRQKKHRVKKRRSTKITRTAKLGLVQEV